MTKKFFFSRKFFLLIADYFLFKKTRLRLRLRLAGKIKNFDYDLGNRLGNRSVIDYIIDYFYENCVSDKKNINI